MPNWKELFIAVVILVVAAIVWLFVGIAIVSWLPLSGEVKVALGAGWLIASGLGVIGARELLSRLMHPGDYEHRYAENRAGVAESERVTLMAKASAALTSVWKNAEEAKLDRDRKQAVAEGELARDTLRAVLAEVRASAAALSGEAAERHGRGSEAVGQGALHQANAKRIRDLIKGELGVLTAEAAKLTEELTDLRAKRAVDVAQLRAQVDLTHAQVGELEGKLEGALADAQATRIKSAAEAEETRAKARLYLGQRDMAVAEAAVKTAELIAVTAESEVREQVAWAEVQKRTEEALAAAAGSRAEALAASKASRPEAAARVAKAAADAARGTADRARALADFIQAKQDEAATAATAEDRADTAAEQARADFVAAYMARVRAEADRDNVDDIARAEADRRLKLAKADEKTAETKVKEAATQLTYARVASKKAKEEAALAAQVRTTEYKANLAEAKERRRNAQPPATP